MEILTTDSGWVFDEMSPFIAELLRILPACAAPEDDAARKRIFSSPTSGDEPEADDDWREYVEPDLRELFKTHVDVVTADLRGIRASEVSLHPGSVRDRTVKSYSGLLAKLPSLTHLGLIVGGRLPLQPPEGRPREDLVKRIEFIRRIVSELHEFEKQRDVALDQFLSSFCPADGESTLLPLSDKPGRLLDPPERSKAVQHALKRFQALGKFRHKIKESVATGDLSTNPQSVEAFALSIPAENGRAWIHTLNQARLALGARHDVTDDDTAGQRHHGGEKGFAIMQIDFYGMILSVMLGRTEL
ncbi:MAG: hypothetical protein ABIP20_17865 [Chthoniobacteraceae bacterium]